MNQVTNIETGCHWLPGVCVSKMSHLPCPKWLTLRPALYSPLVFLSSPSFFCTLWFLIIKLFIQVEGKLSNYNSSVGQGPRQQPVFTQRLYCKCSGSQCCQVLAPFSCWAAWECGDKGFIHWMSYKRPGKEKPLWPQWGQRWQRSWYVSRKAMVNWWMLQIPD